MEFVSEASEAPEGPENIWVASSDGDIKRVQELLVTGEATVNQQDDNGYSPIHAAVSYGHIQLIQILLTAGANPNLRDLDGDTPLHVCELREVAELLIAHGADPLLLNSVNQSIYDVAVDEENEEMIDYLIANNLNLVSAPGVGGLKFMEGIHLSDASPTQCRLNMNSLSLQDYFDLSFLFFIILIEFVSAGNFISK
eukprot:gene9579-19905_t